MEIGTYDGGLKRIRSLIEDIDDAVGNEKPEPIVLLPAKKPVVPPPKRDQPAATTKR
jgi:hypothetical protein